MPELLRAAIQRAVGPGIQVIDAGNESEMASIKEAVDDAQSEALQEHFTRGFGKKGGGHAH
jgi:hypothetical protein